jgi:ketosteroid isomerase-like protein
MSRSFGLLVVALAVAAPLRAQTAGLSEKDRAAIRDQTVAFAKAINSADWPGAAALYTDSANFMPPNQPPVTGPSAIQGWMKAFPPIKEFVTNIAELDGRGDLAFARGTYSLTFTPPGAPGPVKDNGKYVVVFRRQQDGSWKMSADIFNSDLPVGQ